MPVRAEAVMGTVVTIEVLASGCDLAIDRAFGWFHEVERRCTRFNSSSELMKLAAQPGVPVVASPLFYEAVKFALLVAEESGGAFDPTVGYRMALNGFHREYNSGDIVATTGDDSATYKDIELDPDRKTILMKRPLTLDLGAVAKGLAIDTAALELAPFENFAIEAGGDMYLGGLNRQGKPWAVGIRHPRVEGETITTLRVSNKAVCTSGDYERKEHILDPRLHASPCTVASATVVAPSAMLADAVATAAFVLGPEEGIQFLNRMGVEGLIVAPDLLQFETRGLRHA